MRFMDTLNKAEWWQRLAAYFIDAGVAAFYAGIAYIFVDKTTAIAVFELFFFFNFVIGWKQGQTIGMIPLKIRVITTDGKSLTWLRSLWRYIAFTISLFSVIGMVWILFDPKSQGLHDKLAKTFVIKD